MDKRIDVEAVLAVGLLVLFAATELLLLFAPVPAGNKDYAYAILIALIALTKDAFGRYFQATKGAQEQRQEAAAVAKTLAETAATVATTAAAGTTTADSVTLPPGASVKVSAEEDPDEARPDPDRRPAA